MDIHSCSARVLLSSSTTKQGARHNAKNCPHRLAVHVKYKLYTSRSIDTRGNIDFCPSKLMESHTRQIAQHAPTPTTFFSAALALPLSPCLNDRPHTISTAVRKSLKLKQRQHRIAAPYHRSAEEPRSLHNTLSSRRRLICSTRERTRCSPSPESCTRSSLRSPRPPWREPPSRPPRRPVTWSPARNTPS